MTLVELFSTLGSLGLTLRRRDDDQIEVVGDVSTLTAEVKSALRSQKARLLPLLSGQPEEQRDVAGCATATTDSQDYSYFIWSGEELADPIAFDCETRAIQDDEIPELALASASDGTSHCLIHPQQIGAFLDKHRDRRFVCHNASFDFWVVDQHLRQHRLSESAWWDTADDGRLHDTMFLDMLIELAKSDAAPRPRDLGTLAKEYAGLAIDKNDPYRLRYGEIIGKDWDSVDRGFFEYAIRDSIATYRVYARMVEVAKALAQPHQETLMPDAIRQFGLLTESIQVRAAIALAAITRNGLQLDQQQVERTKTRLHQESDGHVAALRKMPYCDGLFKTDRSGKICVTAKGGTPSISKKRLEQVLINIVNESDVVVEIPRTPKNNTVSTSVKFWSEYRQLHPFIACWVAMSETAKLCQFLGSLQAEKVNPRYTVLVRTGRTSCSSPNIQQLPRKGGFREMVVASPGHYLLAIDYSFIELRTLAAICELRYGTSKLADVIRAGIDPHAYTAAMFCGMDLNNFMHLKSSDQDQYGSMRQQAKAVNFGIPGGLGAASLVAYAHSTYGVELTLEDAQDFRQRLISDIYPELSQYLAEDTISILARNLKTSEERCRPCFDSVALLSGVRNLVRGRRHKANGEPYNQRWATRVWLTLAALNKNPELTKPLANRTGSEQLCRQLFWSSVCTPTGRIRGRVSFSQARNTPFQGLAADGAKLALWTLTKAGYRCVAFVHDEVLVELPVTADHTVEAQRINGIMCKSMEEVTGEVPVACKYALSTRWYKDAAAVFEGDKLIPWRPSVTTTSRHVAMSAGDLNDPALKKPTQFPETTAEVSSRQSDAESPDSESQKEAAVSEPRKDLAEEQARCQEDVNDQRLQDGSQRPGDEAQEGEASPQVGAITASPRETITQPDGHGTTQLILADSLEWLRDQPDGSVDMVFGSPPYAEKGERYGTGSRRWPTEDWVGWMFSMTVEAVRVSKGYVIWVVNGAVRNGQYLPACEGLVWLAHERGIVCERPLIWHKNPPPNRKDFFVNAWEYCLVFKPQGAKPHFDWQAIAEPPKYKSGGHFRQRDQTGKRKRGSDYPRNALARPRDVLYVTVGGGHMGHELAHEGEAAFPLRLAEIFIKTCCPEGGTALDPFIGSGTTAHAAWLLKRNCIGLDIRQSQIDLSRRRLDDVKSKDTSGDTQTKPTG